LRSDAPAGSTSPGGPEQSGDDPWLDDPDAAPDESDGGSASGSGPSQDGDGASYPAPDGEIHARTQTEQANEELQEENAETALDQPSDGSGGE
jgi:hypothetical protein